jgi:zinc/manganese transport system substrate-binding protein
MEDALGLKAKGLDFQWVIMNDSEPSPKMMINYQDLLKDKKVKVLFYNQQVTDNTTKNILNLAKKNDIPVAGVTETMPTNKDAISWMIDTLDATQKALEQTKEKSTAPTKND